MVIEKHLGDLDILCLEDMVKVLVEVYACVCACLCAHMCVCVPIAKLLSCPMGHNYLPTPCAVVLVLVYTHEASCSKGGTSVITIPLTSPMPHVTSLQLARHVGIASHVHAVTPIRTSNVYGRSCGGRGGGSKPPKQRFRYVLSSF